MYSTLQTPSRQIFEIPVLIISFNRPQYVVDQLSSLRTVKPRKIYLASDGPRDNEIDYLKVKEVRDKYISGIDWECELKCNFSENNQGCSLGPINAMRWFFKHEKEGIILEDDILPSEDFYGFVHLMLDIYRENKRIICISGCNLGYHVSPSSLFFSKMMNMWGWATWADRFFQIDFSIQKWKSIKFKRFYLYNKLKFSFWDVDLPWIDFWSKIFDETVQSGQVTWWDYQFIFNQIDSGKLTVFPGVNLVQNVGFESDAMHTHLPDHFAKGLRTQSIEWPIHIPDQINPDRIFYEQFIKAKWSYYKRPNWKYYAGNLLLNLGFHINRRNSL